MKVRDIMTPDPCCCATFEPVQNAARMMKDWDIGSVPVVADKRTLRLVGIVTDRDLCGLLTEGRDPATTAVEAVMTRDPATCKPEDDVSTCARIMQEHQVRRVPVVDDLGHCVGVVAQADLALNAKPRTISETVAEISKLPTES
jgi:CBS domain-containing protein